MPFTFASQLIQTITPELTLLANRPRNTILMSRHFNFEPFRTVQKKFPRCNKATTAVMLVFIFQCRVTIFFPGIKSRVCLSIFFFFNTI